MALIKRKVPRGSDNQPLATDNSFPRASRLRKTYQYEIVRTQGKSKRGALLRISCFSSSQSNILGGIIVSRRVGGSVVRNKVKRRLRELYRQSQSMLLPGCWIVFIATSSAATASLAELRAEWFRLGKELSIFQKN